MSKQNKAEVRMIPLGSIVPNPENPRGKVEEDESFERLIDSIRSVGVLVPLVVIQQQDGRYLLVDGERRYRASKELGKEEVPAHILEKDSERLRSLMFHLHMTREQWSPLAQCRALVEEYPQLDNGIPFEHKPEWVKRLADEKSMSVQTAQDRVHVLAWDANLKQNIYNFNDQYPNKNIYSYVLAIEASIIEPSLREYPEYFNTVRTVQTGANEIRARLLAKVESGLETGRIRRRDQVRFASSLFSKLVPADRKGVALELFKSLVEDPTVEFEDLRLEMTDRLPEAVSEGTPKPKKLIAEVKSLTRILREYDPQLLNEILDFDGQQDRLRQQLKDALEGLHQVSEELAKRL